MCAMSNRELSSLAESVFVGGRVVLSFLEMSDAEELLYLVDTSRSSLGKWLPWVEGFRTLQDARSSIDAYETQRRMGNGGAFGIRLEEDGALAGEFILQWIDAQNRIASLGYFLGSAFEGKGLAWEAGRLVLGFLRTAGIHRVEVSAATENAKSNALAERLGFRMEGIAEDAEFLHGKFWNHNRWALVFGESDRSGYDCKH